MAEAAMPRLMPLIWRRWSPGYDATEDLAHLARALPDRRHWSMALGYYRAAARPWTWGRSPYATEQAGWLVTPTMPLLYLHGRNDGCVGVAAADGVAAALAPGSEVAVIDGCGHFLQLEDPSEIAARIVSWINPERTA
jgi:pimeloyl-ACP methyl ester carboxylesterase